VDDLTFRAGDGKRLPCRDREQRTEYVETASGLRLRVTRSGARSWCIAYWSRVAKTTRRLKLGDAAVMPLSKARTAARAALAAVETQGRDPYAERAAQASQEREERRRRAEARLQARTRRAPTVAAVCRAYIEHRAALPSGRFGRPARPYTVSLWNGLVRNHVEPSIGGSRSDRVTPEDIVGALEAAVRRGGPSMGVNLRNFLAAAWRWAERRPKALGGAVAPIAFGALEQVGRPRQQRERSLRPGEVWRLWRATADEGIQGELLRFILLTAARVKEAARLPWSELDLARGTWTLPADRCKTARERAIPLSRPAVALLERVKPEAKGRFVFGGAGRVEALVIGRVRERMKGEHWEPRDLRRTCATICASLKTDPFTIALLLGHARADARVPVVTATYNRWNYADQVRAALERFGEWVDDTVSRDREPGDVVSLEARR
jgi:integrase